MIGGRVKRSDRNVIVLEQLRTLDERIIDAAAKGLARGLEAVVSSAQLNYLSGPRPLHLDVVTRRLRNSITQRVDTTSRGVVGRVGTNVSYARFHEFGFEGPVRVKSHTRINAVRGTRGQDLELRRSVTDQRGGMRFTETTARALQRERSRKNPGSFFVSSSTVKAHTRNLQYKGRPFIAPALAKNRTLILNEVRRAIDLAVGGKGGIA